MHADINVINIRGHCGERYSFELIDECTSMKFKFSIVKRSHVAREFKEFMIWAERVTNRKIKCVRTDNAKEFRKGNFKRLLGKLGIEQQFTQKYEHEQGRKIERSIRTTLDKARCMLSDSNLPKQYWPDAVRTAAFVANRSPIAGKDKTP